MTSWSIEASDDRAADRSGGIQPFPREAGGSRSVVMTAPAKFLFDNDFSRSGKSGPAGVPFAQHHATLAEAEARGFRSGHAAGKTESVGETERQLAAALDRASAGLEA